MATNFTVWRSVGRGRRNVFRKVVPTSGVGKKRRPINGFCSGESGVGEKTKANTNSTPGRKEIYRERKKTKRVSKNKLGKPVSKEILLGKRARQSPDSPQAKPFLS